MSKRTASLAIGILTFAAATPIMGLWAIIPAIVNALFIHEFLTMKGH